MLASAGFDQTIRLWDVHTGVTWRILQGHTAGLVGLKSWQEQGQQWLYSTSNDGTVKRWPSVLTEQWLVNLNGEPFAAAISPDGKYVVVGFNDGSLQVYDLTTHVLVQKIDNAHNQTIARLAFNHRGTRFASGGSGGIVKIWAMNPDGQIELVQSLEGNTDLVRTVAFSPDDLQLVTTSYDGRIGLFLLADEHESLLFKAHQGRATSVGFDKTGKQLLSAGGDDFTLKLWNLDTQPPAAETLAVANDGLLWSSFSPDGTQVVSVGREQVVTVYSTQDASETIRLNGHEQTVLKAIFSPDSRQLATVSADMTVRLWDLDTRSELFRFRLPYEFNNQTPLWDFDFRCTPTGCWIAVPLTSGKLALYNLGKINYE